MTETDTAEPPSSVPREQRAEPSRFRSWLLDGLIDKKGNHPGPGQVPNPTHRPHSWWKVMCLTGVDYFSTLGYQPGIAALAAGLLSPLATIVLVLLTLFGALPVYRRVARESFRGEGSIAMLERLLPKWLGKLFVLALLGFAATDFLITMTLSAADATAHLVENPFVPRVLGRSHHADHAGPAGAAGRRCSCAASARPSASRSGWSAVYLTLNLVVVVVGLEHVVTAPSVVADWRTALTTSYSSPLGDGRDRAAGLPQAGARPVRLRDRRRGDAAGRRATPSDTEDHPVGRIRGTRRLLTTAAVIMSVFLITSQHHHHAADPAAGVPAGRRGQRPRAGLPGARVPRQRVRHRLRRLDHHHPVVRRGVGDGRPAEPGAALPAAVRDGAGVGEGGPPAGAGLRRHRVRASPGSSTPTSTRRAAPTRPASWC